ncbi:hypothetical protein B0H14DRAFT_3674367 [Mycena olivaceomarginata]|nr:hypothetical protein B0H14DRAFT_3674367 [Mycena olivaceomarginata]
MAFGSFIFLVCTIFFGTEDLLPYFQNLSKTNKVPTLNILLENSALLTDRYVSQAATQHSLSASEATSNEYNNQVPQGTPWTGLARSAAVSEPPPGAELDDLPDLVEIQERIMESQKRQILRNSQIFMMDMGWWVEMAHAVPEGDIGRVWEILKSTVFLRYEASKDLKNTILNNWLVNVEGELGKYLPGDLHQEHYNRWLKDMATMHGGEFDENLKRRSKTHTSPHLRNELHLLLTMFNEQEVHLFCSGRSMGHATVNQFARGCRRLEEGKLKEWLDRSLCLGDFLEELNRPRDLPNPSPLPEPAPLHEDSGSDSESARGSNSPLPHGSSSPVAFQRQQQKHPSDRLPDSNLSFAEPHEPEDDGEDLSQRKLSSGSFKTTYVDQDTGFLEYGDNEEDEGLEEKDGEQGDVGGEEEEDEPEGSVYAHSDGEIESDWK